MTESYIRSPGDSSDKGDVVLSHELNHVQRSFEGVFEEPKGLLRVRIQDHKIPLLVGI